VAKRRRDTQRPREPSARASAPLPKRKRVPRSPGSEEYFRELPDLVRRARARIADAPDALRHLADSLETAVHDFGSDDEPSRLESASVQILAGATAAGTVLLDLAVFAGRLAELARAFARAELR
jgi:hypothetical protein